MGVRPAILQLAGDLGGKGGDSGHRGILLGSIGCDPGADAGL
jgi:hypothetical protein